MSWRWPVLALAALLAASGLWAVGFDAYNRAARRRGAPPPPADGIVALTGGADRIETALRLLAEGKAPALLISGVGRGSDLPELARRVQLDPAALAQRVTLGHAATSTAGNAAETAAWARGNDVRRLIVVTAGYHMPRALLEIERDLPGVEFFPVPVQPPAMRGRTDLATTPPAGERIRQAAGGPARPQPAPQLRGWALILLRSALFNVFFFGVTALLGLLGVFVRWTVPDRTLALAQLWSRTVLAGASAICGITVRVTGPLPTGAALIASQHQSAFDTLIWVKLMPKVSYVFKAELARIPLFGPMLVASGQIPLDRAATLASVRGLLRAAERAKADGRQIVIFPEGTRVALGSDPPIRGGVALIAARTGLPVIPVATDSGRYWGRRAFRKRPGCVRIHIGEPIPPDLPQAELVAALKQRWRAAGLAGTPVGNSVDQTGAASDAPCATPR